MTVIADQVLQSEQDYSFLEYKQCGFIGSVDKFGNLLAEVKAGTGKKPEA